MQVSNVPYVIVVYQIGIHTDRFRMELKKIRHICDIYFFSIQIQVALFLNLIFVSQECDSELKEGEPLLQDVILYGRELTQDDLFDENEKENITRDMAQLQENYDELRNFVDDEQERFVFSIVIHIQLFIAFYFWLICTF